jgi:hypothetical protein
MSTLPAFKDLRQDQAQSLETQGGPWDELRSKSRVGNEETSVNHRDDEACFGVRATAWLRMWTFLKAQTWGEAATMLFRWFLLKQFFGQPAKSTMQHLVVEG